MMASSTDVQLINVVNKLVQTHGVLDPIMASSTDVQLINVVNKLVQTHMVYWNR